MVTVKKRVLGKQAYYYLEHSYRAGGKVQKKEKYLGKRLPKDLEAQKRLFLYDIYKEKWFGLFDRIKKGFSLEQRALPKPAQEKELETFAIHFTYDTNRIEGSKLTLRETADLLERGITPKEKPVRDIKEAESHRRVFFGALKYPKDLSLQATLEWHRGLFKDTKPGIAGKIRTHHVAIAGSRFVPPFPAEVYPLLREFFRWYEKNKAKLHPIELAALVHLKFVTIHPFSDGNGRISRLLMNFVLNKRGFPMLIVHYEKRASYYNALERSQMKSDPSPFLNWFFRKYAKENSRYLLAKS
jgi:Fic family protein